MSETVGSPGPEAVESLVFGSSRGKLLESGIQEISELADTDQMLIAALQAQPRATWRDIGHAVNISASSAARRWERLAAGGVAWICAYPARLVTTVGYCWVSVLPSERRRVGSILAANPAAYWIEALEGDFAFFVAIRATSLREFHAAVESIEALPGVASMRTQVVRSVLHDGSRWQPRAVGPVDPRTPAVWGIEPAFAASPTQKDLRLWTALMRNGRASYIELATESGYSERALRERLPRMLHSGALTTRCDVCQEALGLPVGMFLSIRGTSQGPKLARVARRVPGIRVVAGVSGSAPFLLLFWLPAPSEAERVLATLHATIPDLEVERVDFCVRSIKRYGRFFGPDGRVAGLQPGVGEWGYTMAVPAPIEPR